MIGSRLNPYCDTSKPRARPRGQVDSPRLTIPCVGIPFEKRPTLFAASLAPHAESHPPFRQCRQLGIPSWTTGGPSASRLQRPQGPLVPKGLRCPFAHPQSHSISATVTSSANSKELVTLKSACGHAWRTGSARSPTPSEPNGL